MESAVNPKPFEHEPMTAFTFGTFQAKEMVEILMSTSDESRHSEPLDEDETFRLQRVDRAISRSLGNFNKLNEGDERDLAFDEEPFVLVIPNRKIRIVRCLALVETFDQTVALMHSAWINQKIALRTRADTTRTLQGRLYTLFHRLLDTPIQKKED